MTSVISVCEVVMAEGICGRPVKVKSRAMCSMHYTRWQRGRDMGKSRRYPEAESAEGKFWALARPATEPEGCWGWAGGRNRWGYGLFTWDDEDFLAHMFACALLNGSRPEGLCALHKCGPNPWCVNPNHLAWGTRAENAADMVADGTSLRGTRSAQNKLTEVDVLAIYMSSEQQDIIARRYGIAQVTVSRIKNGKRWSWLTGAYTAAQ